MLQHAKKELSDAQKRIVLFGVVKYVMQTKLCVLKINFLHIKFQSRIGVLL